MFSATMTSTSALVEKATNDLLIGPDWGMNMDLCDLINNDAEQAKDVVKALVKRLKNKNSKVQLLTLTVLETIMKNCGYPVHIQVAQKDMLPEMVKLATKRADYEVRDKILELLDVWQEAFGGMGGKYPQFFHAYDELRRKGMEFPVRSESAASMFTTPPRATSPTYPSYGGSPQRHGGGGGASAGGRSSAGGASAGGGALTGSDSSTSRADMTTEDLATARSTAGVLSDMLNAVDVNDRQSVKDEVIVELVEQCRTAQRRLAVLVGSTSDETLLMQGLALNDELTNVLAKRDAIATGTPLPREQDAAPRSRRESMSASLAYDDDEDEDDFGRLAHSRGSVPRRPSQGLAGPRGAPLPVQRGPPSLPAPPGAGSMPLRRLSKPPGERESPIDLLSGDSLALVLANPTPTDTTVPASSTPAQPTTYGNSSSTHSPPLQGSQGYGLGQPIQQQPQAPGFAFPPPPGQQAQAGGYSSMQGFQAPGPQQVQQQQGYVASWAASDLATPGQLKPQQMAALYGPGGPQGAPMGQGPPGQYPNPQQPGQMAPGMTSPYPIPQQPVPKISAPWEQPTVPSPPGTQPGVTTPLSPQQRAMLFGNSPGPFSPPQHAPMSMGALPPPPGQVPQRAQYYEQQAGYNGLQTAGMMRGMQNLSVDDRFGRNPVQNNQMMQGGYSARPSVAEESGQVDRLFGDLVDLGKKEFKNQPSLSKQVEANAPFSGSLHRQG